MTHTSTRGRHAAPARTPMAVLSQAASSPSNRRGVLVFASSGLILTMAATTASASPENTVSATPVAGEATVSDAAVAALALAPSVVVPSDVEFDGVGLEADSKPAPVIVQAARTTTRAATTSAGGSSASSTAATEVSYAPVASSGIGGSIVSIARQYVGTPYVYGGKTPAGFDCSGFTSYVYAQLGIDLPRSSGAQRGMGTVIPRSQAKPGDLIWSPGHVAIYAGGNTQIDAPRPGKSVQFRSIWQSNPTFIRLG